MIAIVGILVAVLVYTLAAPPRAKQGEASRRLAEMYSMDMVKTLNELKPSSLEYKLLAAGVKFSPLTFRALTLGLALASVTAAWLFLPGLPALIAGGIAGYLPFGWL